MGLFTSWCHVAYRCSGLMVLGSEVDDESLLTFERGSGLIGLVSYVYMWNVTLVANGEITTMAESRDNLVSLQLLVYLPIYVFLRCKQHVI